MADLLDTNEASAILDCSPQWVMQLLRAGKLKGQKIGGKWIIERSELEAYKSQQDTKSKGE